MKYWYVKIKEVVNITSWGVTGRMFRIWFSYWVSVLQPPSPSDPPRTSMCSSMMQSWSLSPVETLRSQPQDSPVPLRNWNRRTVKLGKQDLRHSSMYGHVCMLLSYLYTSTATKKDLPYWKQQDPFFIAMIVTVYRCGTKLRNMSLWVP